jgi:hypothetical protein
VDERESWMRGSRGSEGGRRSEVRLVVFVVSRRVLILDYKSPVSTGYNRSFTGSHISQHLGNRQPQPMSDLGNRNRKSGCHQSGSVGSTVFFRSYAPDFQTLAWGTVT